MGYPWATHGKHHLMGGPRAAYGLPMGYPWATHGPPVVITGSSWAAHGLPMGSPGYDTHALPMGYRWTIAGRR